MIRKVMFRVQVIEYRDDTEEGVVVLGVTTSRNNPGDRDATKDDAFSAEIVGLAHDLYPAVRIEQAAKEAARYAKKSDPR